MRETSWTAPVATSVTYALLTNKTSINNKHSNFLLIIFLIFSYGFHASFFFFQKLINKLYFLEVTASEFHEETMAGQNPESTPTHNSQVVVNGRIQYQRKKNLKAKHKLLLELFSYSHKIIAMSGI